MSTYVAQNKSMSEEDYWRRLVHREKNVLFDKYHIKPSEVYHPGDITSEIYNEITYGLFWCYWDDFDVVTNNMLVLTSNNFFVLTTHVMRDKRQKFMRVWTEHGGYTSEKKPGTPVFYIYSPMAYRNRDKDFDGIGRTVTPAFTGYKLAIKNMAVLMAYGVSTQDAYEVAFRGNPGNSHGSCNYSLAEVIKRPDLVEELKVELREAFEAKGITPDWLVDQLKAIAENPDHKQQFDTLMMMGRVLGVGLDTYAKPELQAPDNSHLLMGYASKRSLGPGGADGEVSEAVVVGPPDSVRAALEGSN